MFIRDMTVNRVRADIRVPAKTTPPQEHILKLEICTTAATSGEDGHCTPI